MIRELLRARIEDYAPANELEQENVLQELMQHFVLGSLSRAGFFQRAVFHGGTCLRILYGMARFSEDLDFFLAEPDPEFSWKEFLDSVSRDCRQEGIEFEAVDRSDLKAAVKKAFLKTDSLGKLLVLDLPFERHRRKKIRIKLEIDCHPPAGSSIQARFLTFPRPATVVAQTLPSGFGTKAHALLCRQYDKGRDWYDFVWYVSKRIELDLPLLANALAQAGPWAGLCPQVTLEWFREKLAERIEKTDWETARQDVFRFVPTREQPTLALWSRDFFLQLLEQVVANVGSK